MFKRENFIKLRKEQRKSARFIAEKIGKSRDAVTNWELGRSEPKERYIRLLAKELDVPVGEISHLVDNPFPSEEEKLVTLGTTFKNAFKEIRGYDDQFLKNEYQKFLKGLTDTGKKIFADFFHKDIIISSFMESMPLLIYIKDYESKIITVNKSFLKCTGLSLEHELIGYDEYKFFHKREAKSNIEEDLDVMTTGRKITNRKGFIPGSRKKRHALISKVPIYDKSGKVIGLIGTFTDITEMDKANLFKGLFEVALRDHISDGLFFIQTKTDKYIYVNSATEDITGYTLDDFNSDKELWHKVIHPDDKEKSIPVLNRVDDVGLVRNLTFRIIDKSGKTKTVNSKFSRFTHNYETYTVGTLREIL